MSSPAPSSTSASLSAAPSIKRHHGPSVLGGSSRRMSTLVDLSSFSNPSFRPEAYLRATLPDDSPDAIEASLRTLEQVRVKIITELCREVFRNYQVFVQISKETFQFDGELAEVRAILGQVRQASLSLISTDHNLGAEASSSCTEEHEEAQDSPLSLLSPAAPSPPVDVQNRMAKMTQIYETVSGMEKFSAGTPSRLLVLEGSGVSLLLGAGKPPKPIVLFLFNDALAFASKKLRIALGSSKKYMLEQFFRLSQISARDVSESDTFRNCFKIICGTESFTIQADTPAAKKLWMDHLLKTIEAAKHVPEPAKPESPAAAHKRPAPSKAKPVSRTPETPILAIQKDISDDQNRVMISLLAQLNRLIAKCEYEAAVELVEKAKYDLEQMEYTAPRLHALKSSLNLQIAKLTSFLFHEISRTIISKKDMIHYIQLLIVLGYADEAREHFLASRSEFIRQKSKLLHYTGNIARTVNDLGFVVFSSIAATAEWYNDSFKDVIMTSDLLGFVFWTKVEISNFVNIISKQIFRPDADFSSVSEHLQIARYHCKSLQKIGMDFVFCLDSLLAPFADQMIAADAKSIQDYLQLTVNEDQLTEPVVPSLHIDSDIHITMTAERFSKAILDLLNRVEPLSTDEISTLLVRHVSALFEFILTCCIKQSYTADLNISHFLMIISNVSFIVNHFLPSISAQLTKRFSRSFPEMKRLAARLEASLGVLFQIFTTSCTKNWLPTDFEFYGLEEDLANDADVSQWLKQLLPLLTKVSREVPSERRQALMESLNAELIDGLKGAVQEGKISFGTGGLQQFLLDINFINKACAQFQTSASSASSGAACDLALKQFKDRLAPGQKVSMKPPDWFQNRVQVIIQQVGRYMLDFGN